MVSTDSAFGSNSNLPSGPDPWSRGSTLGSDELDAVGIEIGGLYHTIFDDQGDRDHLDH